MTLSLRRGDAYVDTRRLVITAVDAAGVAIDLTGTAIRFMVKAALNDADADAILSKVTGSGITLADPQSGATLGKAYIAIAAADTTSLRAGRYWYELEATDSIGVITLAAGTFMLVADLIRGA